MADHRLGVVDDQHVLYDNFIPFLYPPPLTLEPINFPSYGFGSSKAVAFKQEVEMMLSKNAFEVISDQIPAFYS